MFNAEVCYGSGLQYNTDSCGGDVKREVEDFKLDNALPSYFLGVCQDFKHFYAGSKSSSMMTSFWTMPEWMPGRIP